MTTVWIHLRGMHYHRKGCAMIDDAYGTPYIPIGLVFLRSGKQSFTTAFGGKYRPCGCIRRHKR